MDRSITTSFCWLGVRAANASVPAYALPARLLVRAVCGRCWVDRRCVGTAGLACRLLARGCGTLPGDQGDGICHASVAARQHGPGCRVADAAVAHVDGDESVSAVRCSRRTTLRCHATRLLPLVGITSLV